LKSLFDTSCCTSDGNVEHCVIGGEKDRDKVEDESEDDGRLCNNACKVDTDEKVFISD
jgi:hypothetical protein